MAAGDGAGNEKVWTVETSLRGKQFSHEGVAVFNGGFGYAPFGVTAACASGLRIHQQIRHGVGGVGAEFQGGGMVGHDQHSPGADFVQAFY